MDKLNDHWILDLVLLAALLLGSAWIYVFRLGRAQRFLAKARFAETACVAPLFSDAAMQTLNSEPAVLTRPIPAKSATREGHTDGRGAWNTLQVRLLAIVESDEDGGESFQDLYRVIAEYDARRDAAMGIDPAEFLRDDGSCRSTGLVPDPHGELLVTKTA